MLTVNQQEINLGNLRLSIPHPLKYTLKNTGNKDIKINQIFLGCNACTTASMAKNLIKPGESEDLNAIFTPGSKGLALKSITVKWSETGKGENSLYLTFRAKIDG